MVPEARVELARLSTTVFETAASAIPPLGHEIELYPMFPKAQTEISEHAQKATMQAEKTVRTGTEASKRGAEPYGSVFCQMNIARKRGAVGDERSFLHVRTHALEFDDHGVPPSS